MKRVAKALVGSVCLLAVVGGSPAQAFKIGGDIGRLWENTKKTFKKALRDADVAINKAVRDLDATRLKGQEDVARAVEQAGKDTSAAAEKAIKDVGDAGVAVAKYYKSLGQNLGNAADNMTRRIAEGKLVDALWHLQMDYYRSHEGAAAEAMEQSNVIRAAAQLAATAYAGPGGAAAFAAWWTYRQTGDFEAALRAGVLSGAASTAGGTLSEIPNTTDMLVKKAVLSGALAGAAVGAAGGDMQAVQEGFLKGGGMVLIQSAYIETVGERMDLRASVGEPYCMNSPSVFADCTPPLEAYKGFDHMGRPFTNAKGEPMIDVRLTDLRRPHVGMWASKDNDSFFMGTETSGFMVGVSKFPGMNAVAVGHDHASYAMGMGGFANVATIPPAIVVTYYGTDNPTINAIIDAATKEAEAKAATEAKAANEAAEQQLAQAQAEIHRLEIQAAEEAAAIRSQVTEGRQKDMGAY